MTLLEAFKIDNGNQLWQALDGYEISLLRCYGKARTYYAVGSKSKLFVQPYIKVAVGIILSLNFVVGMNQAYQVWELNLG